MYENVYFVLDISGCVFRSLHARNTEGEAIDLARRVAANQCGYTEDEIGDELDNRGSFVDPDGDTHVCVIQLGE